MTQHLCNYGFTRDYTWWTYHGEANRMRDDVCDTPAQSLIGLIGYSYQQVATSFPEAGLQITPRLSVLGQEKFGDG